MFKRSFLSSQPWYLPLPSNAPLILTRLPSPYLHRLDPLQAFKPLEDDLANFPIPSKHISRHNSNIPADSLLFGNSPELWVFRIISVSIIKISEANVRKI